MYRLQGIIHLSFHATAIHLYIIFDLINLNYAICIHTLIIP